MVRAVEERRLEVGERVAGDDALLGLLAHALLDGGEEVLRHRAADDARRVDDAGSRRERLDLEPAVAELAVATGLPLVAALGRRLRADRLAIRDPRRARVDADPGLVR